MAGVFDNSRAPSSANSASLLSSESTVVQSEACLAHHRKPRTIAKVTERIEHVTVDTVDLYYGMI